MQRQNFPLRRADSVLLYGFGLALVLSLAFNGFLLYEKSRQRDLVEYELSNSMHPVEQVVWLQQLSDCKRANQEKDSLIRRLAQAPHAPPPGRAITVHLHSSK
ncbi:hypothetical protein [uncultured Fibrella sp.]|uniref:hypothetical protein n=1 Tax=uncultured Fibrella sp. TaxID=1284596 RepID=UPI0035CA2009